MTTTVQTVKGDEVVKNVNRVKGEMVGELWHKKVKLGFHFAVSGVVIVVALLLFIYPAIFLCTLAFDSQLRQTGESRLATAWFQSATPRFTSWATMYLDTNYAASISSQNIPATEWPMFGAAFYLLTAEDLQKRGKIDATQGNIHEAVEKAVRIIASPATATWVKTKWGDGYLEKENVFYRMLFILGLASYENLTGNTEYRAMMSQQRTALADELGKAKLHLRDDYPGECYPADMLWGRRGNPTRRAIGRFAARRARQRPHGSFRRAALSRRGAARLSGRFAIRRHFARGAWMREFGSFDICSGIEPHAGATVVRRL